MQTWTIIDTPSETFLTESLVGEGGLRVGGACVNSPPQATLAVAAGK